MPGLFGCAKNTGKKEEVVLGLQKISYRGNDILEPVFCDDRIINGQVNLNIKGTCSYYCDPSGLYCWIEGFCLNLEEFKENSSLAQVLSMAYIKGELEKKLKEVNGTFSAVIYDNRNFKLLLITDRYGMKPLYLWKENNYLAWASELKSFLSLDNFTPKISKTALSCFMELGQLLGSETWFEKVELLGASTILEIGLNNNAPESRKRYWSWGMVQPQKISFDEAVEGLGNTLEKSVKKNAVFSGRVGLSVSGGLDSRAILAAFPHDQVVALTFGREEAEDVKIARTVGAIKGIPHYFFHLNASNWLENRCEGVWKTDGMMNLYHLHASAFQNQISELIDLELNGFGGGVICGATWMKNLNSRIKEKTAFDRFGPFFELTSLNDSFFDIEKEDCYFIDTRLRRFTNVGTTEVSRLIENRKPFIDNELIEYIFSLPDDYRHRGRLYHASLIRRFPAYFKKVPYQALGYPIGKRFNFPFRLKQKFERVWHTRVLRKEWSPSYADYPLWFHERMAKIKSILMNPQALILEYISREEIREALDSHNRKGVDNSEKIGKLLTMEIWFQRVADRGEKTNTKLLCNHDSH